MKWKKQEGGILCAFLASLSVSVVEPVIFSVVKSITGKGVMRAKREYYNNKNNSFLVLLHLLSNSNIIKDFNDKPRFSSLFSRDILPRIKMEWAYTLRFNIFCKKY